MANVLGEAWIAVRGDWAAFQAEAKTMAAPALAEVEKAGTEAGVLAGGGLSKGVKAGATEAEQAVESSGKRMVTSAEAASGGILSSVSGMFGHASERATEGGKSLAEPFFNLKTVSELGVAAAVGGLVELGANMQQVTGQIAANAAITQKQADSMGQAFNNTAGEFTFTGKAMAGALAPVIGQLDQMTGHVLSNKEAVDFMRQSTELAEATHSNLNTSTAALTATMQTYHIALGNAAGATDVLYNVSRVTNTPIDAVSSAVDRLKARLGDAAPSLQDTGALMDEMSAHGVVGQRGIAMVSAGLNTLLGGSKATEGALGSLGVHVYDASGKFVGMDSVIGQLQPKLSKMTDEQRRQAETALFGASAGSVLGAIIQDGSKKYDEMAGAVGRAGSAHAAAEQVTGTFEGQLNKTKAAAVDMATSLGTFLLPAATEVLKLLGAGARDLEAFLMPVFHEIGNIVRTDVVPAFGVMRSVFADLGQALSGDRGALDDTSGVLRTLVNAALSVGDGFRAVWPVVSHVFSDLKTGVGDLVDFVRDHWKLLAAIVAPLAAVFIAVTAPVIATVAAIGAAGFLLVSHWQQISTDVKHWVGDMVGGIESFFKPLTDFISSNWDSIKTVTVEVWHLIKGVVDVAMGEIRAVIDVGMAVIKGVFDVGWAAVKAVFDVTWGLIKGAVELAWNDIKTIFKIAFDLITGIISVGLDLITGKWGKAWDDVKGMVTAVWHDITGFVGTALKTIVDTITGMFGSLVDGLGSIAKAIWSAVTDVFKGAISAVGDLIKGFVGGFKNDVAAIPAWFKALPGDLLGLLKGAVGWLEGIGKDIIHGLVTGVTWYWDHVLVPYYTGIPKVIGGFFTGAIGWLEQVGKDIITGLVHGIESAPSAILDAIKGLVSHIPGASLLSHIPGLGFLGGESGGVLGQSLGVKLMAGGGSIGPGFITSGPVAVVGEGNPAYPEYVIPTDPAFRANAQALSQEVALRLQGGGPVDGSPAALARVASLINELVMAVQVDLLNTAVNVHSFFGTFSTTVMNGLAPIASTAGAASGYLGDLSKSIGDLASASSDASGNASSAASALSSLASAISSVGQAAGSAGTGLGSIGAQGGGTAGGGAFDGGGGDSGGGTSSGPPAGITIPTGPTPMTWDAAQAKGYLESAGLVVEQNGVPVDARSGRVAYYGPQGQPGSPADFEGAQHYWTDPWGRVVYFDDGGLLPPGRSMVMNATGEPEIVLSPMERRMLIGGGGGEVHLHFHNTFNGVTDVTALASLLAGVATSAQTALRSELRAGTRLGALSG